MSRIKFTNRRDVVLAGNLELPAGGVWKATALFAHCFTCTRNIKAARNISRSLAEAGFAVLRFDFTGIGESEGDFSDTDFSSNLDDLEDASGWMAENLEPPKLLVGHSLGGTAVLAVAPRLESVSAIATLAAPSSVEHVLDQFGDALDTIETEGSAKVDLAGRSFRIRKDFVEDARAQSVEQRLENLRRALLILHSPVDKIVGIDNAEDIFTAALHPKSFVSLDKADHLLSDESDSRYAGKVISAWAEHYLDLRSPESVDGVTVSGRNDADFLCRVQAGRHELLADEPERQGGEDQGPDPYRYLAAALGTCTVMTLNMYARRKGLDVERVTCEVTHDRVHVEDCSDCEDSNRKVDRLQRTIDIEGALDEDQRKRMLEIADRCPVHRTLENEIRVESKLA